MQTWNMLDSRINEDSKLPSPVIFAVKKPREEDFLIIYSFDQDGLYFFHRRAIITGL